MSAITVETVTQALAQLRHTLSVITAATHDHDTVSQLYMQITALAAQPLDTVAQRAETLAAAVVLARRIQTIPHTPDRPAQHQPQQ